MIVAELRNVETGRILQDDRGTSVGDAGERRERRIRDELPKRFEHGRGRLPVVVMVVIVIVIVIVRERPLEFGSPLIRRKLHVPSRVAPAATHPHSDTVAREVERLCVEIHCDQFDGLGQTLCRYRARTDEPGRGDVVVDVVFAFDLDVGLVGHPPCLVEVSAVAKFQASIPADLYRVVMTDIPEMADPGETTDPSERLIARFDVTGWDPAETGIDGDWLGAVTMRKVYTEGLVGASIAHFVSSGDESGRGYLAAERVTGTLDDGRTGSFTVHHGALQHPSDDSAFGYIVPGTGTGDFAAFAGTARIVHDEHGPYFAFSLR